MEKWPRLAGGMSAAMRSIIVFPISSSWDRRACPLASTRNGPKGLPILTVTLALRPLLSRGKISSKPSRPTGRIGAPVRAARKAVPGRAGRSTLAQLPASGKMPRTPRCSSAPSAAAKRVS